MCQGGEGGQKHTRLAGVEQAVLHHLGWVIHVIKFALFTGSIHPKNGPSADASINVGGAVQRVKHHHIVATVRLLHCHWLILFFTGNDTLLAKGAGSRASSDAKIESVSLVCVRLEMFA